MTLTVLIILIIILSTYVAYMIHSSKKEMILDKGARKIDGQLIPNFKRPDIQNFFNECSKIGISGNIAKEFVLAIYNTLIFAKEPEMPKLSDNRYNLWDLDWEIEELINYIFIKYNIEKVKWNQKEILALESIQDILIYIDKKTKTL